MRIDTQIEKATAVDTGRMALNAVWLDAERRVVYAADGHILAKVGVETGEGNVSGPIPTEALEHCQDCDHTLIVEDGCVLKRLRDGWTETQTYKCDGKLVPPDFEKILSLTKDAVTTGSPDLVIDAQLLLRLAKALKEKGDTYVVGLWLPKDKNQPVLVKSNRGIGAIMPTVVCGGDGYWYKDE